MKKIYGIFCQITKKYMGYDTQEDLNFIFKSFDSLEEAKLVFLKKTNDLKNFPIISSSEEANRKKIEIWEKENIPYKLDHQCLWPTKEEIGGRMRLSPYIKVKFTHIAKVWVRIKK